MRRVRGVQSGEQTVHGAHTAILGDREIGPSVTGAYAAIVVRDRLQRAYDSRSDGNDPCADGAGVVDGPRRGQRDLIPLRVRRLVDLETRYPGMQYDGRDPNPSPR